MARIAIGVAAGDDAHVHAGGRQEGAAVAHARAGLHALDAHHLRVQRHRRQQAELRGAAVGERAGAIQRQAGAYPLGGCRARRMAQHGGGIAGGNGARQAVDEGAKARVGVIHAIGFVGARIVVQVADFAHHATRGQRARQFERGVIVLGAETGVVDIAGKTQPDRRPLGRRRLRQPVQLREMGDDQVQLRRVQQQRVGRRIQAAIDQHGAFPAQPAAGARFVQVQHREAVGAAQRRQHPCQAMAVGIGLDRGPQPGRAGGGQRRAQAGEVVGHGSRVDAGIQGAGKQSFWTIGSVHGRHLGEGCAQPARSLCMSDRGPGFVRYFLSMHCKLSIARLHWTRR